MLSASRTRNLYWPITGAYCRLLVGSGVGQTSLAVWFLGDMNERRGTMIPPIRKEKGQERNNNVRVRHVSASDSAQARKMSAFSGVRLSLSSTRAWRWGDWMIRLSEYKSTARSTSDQIAFGFRAISTGVYETYVHTYASTHERRS